MSLKQLSNQSLIYGTGHVVARLINFLLLPLYTHTISIQNYGIVSLIYVLIAFANIFIYMEWTVHCFGFMAWKKITITKYIYIQPAGGGYVR